MGSVVTLNYIVKSSNNGELNGILPGADFSVSKDGHRHYVTGVPLYLADDKWQIVGKCVVKSQVTDGQNTSVTCRCLFLFTQEESDLITRLNRLGELELLKEGDRKGVECPVARRWADNLEGRDPLPPYDFLFGPDSEYSVLYAAVQNIIIVYPYLKKIHFAGAKEGANIHLIDPLFHRTEIRLTRKYKTIKTDARHICFNLSNGSVGIVLSKFDLIGYDPYDPWNLT